MIPDHARKSTLDHIASLVQHQRTETNEHEVLLPNGERGWQQWVNHVVDQNRFGVELQGVGRDITERRKAEENLRVSETRFRILADNAPIMIWIAGPDRRCSYLNQGWLTFTGRTLEQELGSGWTEGLHRDDYRQFLDTYENAFERREPFRMEFRLRRSDGQYRWVYENGTPRFSSDDDFLGYIGSCVDISDRKEAEEALRIAHEEVHQLKNQLEEENFYLQEEYQTRTQR